MEGGTPTALRTFVGALEGLSGGWLATPGQGRGQHAEHARRRDEARRDAYRACISASKRLSVTGSVGTTPSAVACGS